MAVGRVAGRAGGCVVGCGPVGLLAQFPAPLGCPGLTPCFSGARGTARPAPTGPADARRPGHPTPHAPRSSQPRRSGTVRRCGRGAREKVACIARLRRLFSAARLSFIPQNG
ncbi:hypothetical protein F9278_21170 [Streptomyces phaeolivaceus]|uniref:Uncharacterized protein n=1 Tax=Streptomyces phaeolivaceus TaxID=2653200 RepID=A0A5P8K4R7_9ACTN|nr:hypothetical protein F9278_21170 [Streptomyces phaeolivaceus]